MEMFMKKVLLVVSLLVVALFAEGMQNGKKMMMYQSVPVKQAKIYQDGEAKMYCPNCGMYLPKFYKTSHMAKLKDGSVRQYCSIYCLVEESEITTLRGKKDSIDKIMVVDVESLKYIDVKDAHYVVGSKKAGTMTFVSKYAFKSKESAQKFATKNGGQLMNFEQAYNVALTDFAKDTAKVYKKRSTKMYKLGKKLYSTQCDSKKIEKIDAHTMAQAKALIKNSNACSDNLNDKELQAVMLYYWDVKLKKFEALYGKNPEVQKYIESMNNKK
jgi:nitrous oxide reductase accessory protein NosL